MIEGWLQYGVRGRSSLKFDVVDVTERPNHSLDDTAPIFGQIFKDTVFGDNVKRLASKMGRTAELERHAVNRIPVHSSMRKGKFGEILEYRILEEFLEFCVLFKKLQLEHRNKSNPGADIVAVKMDKDQVKELTFVECKVVTGTIAAGISVGAYKQLGTTRADLPTQLIHICDNPPESISADAIFEYATGRDPDSCRISLVCDARNWKDGLLTRLNDAICDSMPRLTLDLVRIESLERVIDVAYDVRRWNG